MQWRKRQLFLQHRQLSKRLGRALLKLAASVSFPSVKTCTSVLKLALLPLQGCRTSRWFQWRRRSKPTGSDTRVCPRTSCIFLALLFYCTVEGIRSACKGRQECGPASNIWLGSCNRNIQREPAGGAPAVDARALAAALGSIGSGGMGQQQQQQRMLRAPGPSLAEVLTPEVMLPLLRQPGTLERLAPFLPVSSPSIMR